MFLVSFGRGRYSAVSCCKSWIGIWNSNGIMAMVELKDEDWRVQATYSPHRSEAEDDMGHHRWWRYHDIGPRRRCFLDGTTNRSMEYDPKKIKNKKTIPISMRWMSGHEAHDSLHKTHASPHQTRHNILIIQTFEKSQHALPFIIIMILSK